jgi:hypothetical protein
MATKTHVELTANLQAGDTFLPAGRYLIPGCPGADILQKELDAGAPHLTILGTVEEEDAAAADTTDTTGTRRKPAVTVTDETNTGTSETPAA